MLNELLFAGAIGLIAYVLYTCATLNNNYFGRYGIKSMNIFTNNAAAQMLKKQTALEFAYTLYNYTNEP